jgi:hypothetical protein
MRWRQLRKRDADLERNCGPISNWKKKSSEEMGSRQKRPATRRGGLVETQP